MERLKKQVNMVGATDDEVRAYCAANGVDVPVFLAHVDGEELLLRHVAEVGLCHPGHDDQKVHGRKGEGGTGPINPTNRGNPDTNYTHPTKVGKELDERGQLKRRGRGPEDLDDSEVKESSAPIKYATSSQETAATEQHKALASFAKVGPIKMYENRGETLPGSASRRAAR